MIQFLNVLGDVVRIATFQWHDEKPHRDWCEGEAADQRRRMPEADARPLPGLPCQAMTGLPKRHCVPGPMRTSIVLKNVMWRLRWLANIGMHAVPGRFDKDATGPARGARRRAASSARRSSGSTS